MAFASASDGDFSRLYFTEQDLIDNLYVGDGFLYVCGYNNYGQLGTNTTIKYSSPITTSGGGTNWKQVSCGNYHTAAIKTDGALWTCGYNLYGQLGTYNTSNYSSPVTTSGGGTNWKQVSCGSNFSAAIKTDGTLWVCGYNLYGQLGTNNTTNYSSPATTSGGGTNWKQVSCRSNFSAAIKTDGTLWVWGYNINGQLGTYNTSNYSSPITTSGGGTNWKQVSCGNYHTAAIKTDGTLWVWGYNINGQLGTYNTSNYSSPITTSGGGTNWKQVSCSDYQAAAIKTDGSLWTWGRNNYGNLGTNNSSNYSSPVTTSGGGTNWKQVSGGAVHTAAIKTDGSLWTWGRNIYGLLGTNNSSNYSSPVTTSGGGTNWKQVSCGSNFSAAINTGK